MNEYNQNTESANEIERLRSELAHANGTIHELSGNIEMLGEDIRKKQGIIDKVTALIQDEFNKGNLDEFEELTDALSNLLPLDVEEETEIEIVVRWNCTVTHRKGQFDLGSVEASVDEPELSYYGSGDAEFGYVSHYETEVNEA